MRRALGTFERLIIASFQILLKILTWLIELAPFAICLVIAGVVGATENLPGLLARVGVYFATVMAALGLHAIVYYPLTAWLIGGISPRTLFREGASAILTGFSINSSLATAPLTLKALDRLHVSDSSARLSACVGTNFNNDGITLYEAITALFVAQAAGMELHFAADNDSLGRIGREHGNRRHSQLRTDHPHLGAQGSQFARACGRSGLPIVYSIDFINARVRSAVNVIGDMQVAILLDVGSAHTAPRTAARRDPPNSAEDASKADGE